MYIWGNVNCAAADVLMGGPAPAQLDALNMPASFLDRQVNYGFSVSPSR